MCANYHDAMAIVRCRGRPDYFITMTCNAKWKEITEALGPGQTAQDRPDIVARVFKIKLDMLLKELLDPEHSVFGKVTAHMHVIEFQKRGLPHARILIIVDPADKPVMPEHVDSVILQGRDTI
jgi:cyclophilin family peptidyl-prolyl cis-trans isomerase